MAIEAFLGVLILFNSPLRLFRSIRPWQGEQMIGGIIATLFGVALVVDAVRVRRKLKVLDAVLDQPTPHDL